MKRTNLILSAAILAVVFVVGLAAYASRLEPVSGPIVAEGTGGELPSNNPNDNENPAGGTVPAYGDQPVESVYPAPDNARSITGTYVAGGAECQLLRGDDGKEYSLTGAAVGNAANGDRVRVTGTVAEMSFCMQGTTLNVVRVEKI